MKSDKVLFVGKLVVTLALLFLVLRGVDWGRFFHLLKRVDPVWLSGAFLIGYLGQVLLCTLRWQYVLRWGCALPTRYLTLLRIYWTSLFVGYFVPAGIGSDIYRVLAAVRVYGLYGQQIAAVFFEKIYVFAGDLILVMISYQAASSLMVAAADAGSVMRVIYFTALGMVLLGGLGYLTRRSRSLLFIKSCLKRFLTTVTGKNISAISINRIAAPFFFWKNYLPLLLLTMLIRVFVCSLGGWCLLAAVGVDLPFRVHIFVWSIIYVLFKLPLSIGGFGVREVAYVVLFGLFGVEKEVALMASFLGLACTLLLTGAGGLGLLLGPAATAAESELLRKKLAGEFQDEFHQD